MNTPPLREQIENKCAHFNGVQHDHCKAGVAYSAVRAGSDHGYRYPCFRDKGEEVPCSMRRWKTPEEVQARIDAISAAGRQFAERLTAGLCPHCGGPVKREVQVGRCVYAEPCGHRMYQGTAKGGAA